MTCCKCVGECPATRGQLVLDAMPSWGGWDKLLQLMNDFQMLKVVLLAILLPQGSFMG